MAATLSAQFFYMNQEYHSIAPYYDPATRWFMAPVRRRIVSTLRQGSTAAPETRVLDLGCGTGRQLAALFAAGFHCTRADSSPHMLEQAQKNLEKTVINTAITAVNRRVASDLVQHQRQIELFLVPAEKLPFADNSFDAAVLSLVLHESAADPLAILREASRVAPRLLVLDWKMPERNLDYIAWLPMHIIERLAGCDHYRRFRNYMQNGGLEGLIYRFDLEAQKTGSPRLKTEGRSLLRLGSVLLMDLQRA